MSVWAWQHQDAKAIAVKCLAFAATLFLTACQATPLRNLGLGPEYRVSNTFRQSICLPKGFRRVAVLPLTGEEGLADAAGRTALESVLHTELLKTKRFEAIWVSPEALRHLTGRKTWDADESLPQDLLGKIGHQFGCEGVLFAELSRFHAYPPLAIGWKLRLIETATARTLWAVDEIFDMGEPAVVNSARRYERQHQKTRPVTDIPLVSRSPDLFGRYTACAVLGTLPAQCD